MKGILKKWKFKGRGNTYYRKVGENLWLEFSFLTQELYITDGRQTISLERTCDTATELDVALSWYFSHVKTHYESFYIIIGFITGFLVFYTLFK